MDTSLLIYIHALAHLVLKKYAYMLAQTRTADKAYDMLKRVSEANVFYNDKNYKISLRLALLGRKNTLLLYWWNEY